jgi:lipopolysaccharide/colanic/teichoic acid biosynthesis glycosyltransferase
VIADRRVALLIVIAAPVPFLVVCVAFGSSSGALRVMAEGAAGLAMLVVGSCWVACRIVGHRLRRDGVVPHLLGDPAHAEPPTTLAERSVEWVPHESVTNAMLERGFDLVIALGALMALLPGLAVIGCLVMLEDRGPALFRQARVGRRGHTFHMVKFRTMSVGADARALPNVDELGHPLGPLFNVARDPRATEFGHLLRRTGLDELPQLLNVVRGQMSLVGPRPAMPSEVTSFDADLRRRELVRPGITGLWQVLARDNPSIEVYRRVDRYYVNNRSLVLDIAILGWTVEHVVGRTFQCLAVRPVRGVGRSVRS